MKGSLPFRNLFTGLRSAHQQVELHVEEAMRLLLEGQREALTQLIELMPASLRSELSRIPLRKDALVKMCAHAVLGVRGMNVAALCVAARERGAGTPIQASTYIDFWGEVIRSGRDVGWVLFQEPRLMLENSSKRDPRVEALGLIEFIPDCATLAAFFLAESLVKGRDGWNLDALVRTSSRTKDGSHILVGPSATSPVGVRIEIVPPESDLNRYSYPLAWAPRSSG